MSEEQPIPDTPVETQLTDAQRSENKPREPQPPDPARRLRELLAIPERERSDPVWDEIIGLEIQLAPGNRASAPQADMGRSQEHGRRQENNGRRQDQQRRPDQTPGGAKPGKRFFKKSRRGSGTPPGKR